MDKNKALIEQNEKSIQLTDDIRPFIIGCEKFTTGLNSPPKKKNVKTRQNVEYLPISSIESELDSMFGGLWQTNNLKWQIVANEIVVSIELSVWHPIAQTWLTRSGVGACQIRQHKNSAISDINSKIKNALEMDMPHAKADAIKNAAKSLGKRFGRDLGRKAQDVAKYEPILLSKLKSLGDE